MAEFPKITTGEIIGGAAIIGGLATLGTAAIVAHHYKKKKTARHKARKKNVHRNKRKRLKFGSKAYRKRYLKHGRRKQKQPHTAGKRRDTSHKRIRYTKNNQPYIIKSDGRARFISKKSVRSSRKHKGGKY